MMSVPTVDEIQSLEAKGEFMAALKLCRKLVEATNERPDLLHMCARIARAAGQLEDAYADILMAIELRDDPADQALLAEFECEMLGQQATGLGDQHRYREAEAQFAKAAAISTNVPQLYSAMGHMEMARGNLALAIDLFRQSARHQRGSRTAHSNLLLAQLHSDSASTEDVIAEHRDWAARYTPAPFSPAPIIVDPDPKRPIRVAFLSADLRAHPVGQFLLPLFQNHDPSQIEITCYDDRAAPPTDVMAPLLRAASDHWLCTQFFSDPDLARQVRTDKIDILFDLAVHSDKNRLPFFAGRAAPIQISWLGYAATSGIAAMDYRISDAQIDPPGESESQSTETLQRMPDCWWCYGPSPEAPDVDERPREAAAPLRIGVATRLAKISDTSLRLWAKLLNAVPGAQFILSDQPFVSPAVREDWTARLVQAGIAADRIQLIPGQQLPDYMRLLNSLDIGLDTFPYNGGTTVCNMLYMGTPFVALRGRAGLPRVSTSCLQALGMPELVAQTEAEWLDLNVKLAADHARRAELRRTLRRRLMTSALGDGKRFARNFETLLRNVFVNHLNRTAAV